MIFKLLKDYVRDKKNQSRIESDKEKPGAKTLINLTELRNGNYAEIVDIQCNHKTLSRLEVMRIIPGINIKMKSHFPGKGLIIVEIANIQLALEYNMAKEIIVKAL